VHRPIQIVGIPLEEHVAVDNDYRNTSPIEGGLHRKCGDTPRLGSVRNRLAENGALFIDFVLVDLLREIEPDLRPVDVRCYQYDRRTIAMTFEYAVYEMQASRPGGPGAYRQFSRHVGFTASGQGADLFVTDIDPAEVRTPHGVREMIECVAYDPIATPGPSRCQGLDHYFRDCFRHGLCYYIVVAFTKRALVALRAWGSE
jgi:hypothetical protein